MDIAGRAVALLGNEQVHGDAVVFLLGLGVIWIGVGLVKHPDQIGILFDAAGFAKVRQARFAALSFSSSRFNWLKTITGTLSSLASALMPPEISKISICRFSWKLCGCGVEQLQVINHEQLDAVLLVHPARAGAELEDGQSGAVVNMQRRSVDAAGGGHQFWKVALAHETVADVAQVHAADAEHIVMRRGSDSRPSSPG